MTEEPSVAAVPTPEAGVLAPAEPLPAPHNVTCVLGEEKTASHRCHDCGTEVRERYCPRCGQEYSEKVVSLQRLLSDFVGDVFAWDSKLGRSVGLLLFRPGFLTNAYNAGRRTRYISPWRIYLVSSLIAFFAISWNLRSETGIIDMKSAQQTGAVPSGPNVEMGDPKLDRLLKKPNPVAAYETEQKALPAGKRDNWLQRRVMTRLLQAGKETSGPNADAYFENFIQKVVANIPNGMFVLLPLFAALLKVIYWRSGRYYIEHVVYALHTHAFAFAVITLDIFLDQVWWHYAAPAAAWLYFLLAMKAVYGQGWLKTLMKLVILTVSYLFLLLLTLAGVSLATFFG